MDINAAITDMLANVGEADAEIVSVILVEPGLWAVAFSDDRSIEVEVDVANSRLTFFTDLGEPEFEDRLRIYQTLLNYNMLWQETGGLRMGVSGTGDTVYLIGDIHLPEVSEVSLQEQLSGHARMAAIWSTYVQTGTLSDDSAPFAAGDVPLIRV